MPFAKALKKTHAPIKRQNGGAAINTIEMHTMPSRDNAAKYPKGVVQSNGNLKVEWITWIKRYLPSRNIAYKKGNGKKYDSLPMS